MIFMPWIAFAAIVATMIGFGFKAKRKYLNRRAEETRRLEEEERVQQERSFAAAVTGGQPAYSSAFGPQGASGAIISSALQGRSRERIH